MEEIANILAKLKKSTKDAAWIKSLNSIEATLKTLEDKVSTTIKRLGVIHESEVESDGFDLSESINEDAGMVVDVAMGVAVGLMGLWTVIQGAPVVRRIFGDTADYLADKAEKKAKMALKNQRKETIAPIIAKFKNDTKLADMYQALPAYNDNAASQNQAALKAQAERRRQLTAIGKYIKSKLTPEEMKYFTDISSMLRTGDIK